MTTDSSPQQLPPHVQLMGVVAAKWLAQPLYAIAKLGIADHLDGTARTAEELAELTGVRPGPLGRCLRAAAALSVLTEDDKGRFRLRPMGEALRSEVPCSVRDFTILLGEEPVWSSFGSIMHTLRTGEPAFDMVHGKGLFDYLAEDPELSRVYQGAWASLTEELAPEAVELFDFTRFPVIADIGGGHGRMLQHILRACPDSSGVLMDRQEVVAAARERLQGQPEASRLSFVAGSLPQSSPPPADAYLLKNTLHCFDDDDALAMLLPLAAALRDRPGARLLVIETVVPEGNTYDWSKFIDIEVMVNNGGRERTLEQWRTLLGAAGLALVGTTRITPPQWILEAAQA